MDHVRDREHDAGTSSTSHDVTLTDAASDRIGETAQSEKQGVDASPPSQNEMKDGNSKASLIVVTLAIIMTGMMIFMDLTILVTAIPEITTVFNSLDDIGWYGNAYALSMAVLIPLAGKLTRHFTAKWVFTAFLFFFAVGSAICGSAQSSTMLIVGRAVGGMGASGLFTTGLTIVASASPLEKRPMMYGVVMGVSQAGISLGPIIGGALTEHATWRWCFYINLPIVGCVALAMALLRVPDESVPLKGPIWQAVAIKLDLIGFFILAPSTIMLLLALAYGGIDYPWDSAVVIGLFCGAAVGIAVFLVWEQRLGVEGMFPTPLIRRQIVAASCFSQSLFFGAMYVATYYISIYFQSVQGVSPLTAGVRMLPLVFLQVATVIVTGGLIQRTGYYLPYSVLGGVFLSIGYGCFSTLDRNSSTAQWVGYQIIMGIGRGLPMQAGLLAVQANVGEDLVPVGNAMVLFLQQLGGSIFLAVARVIFGEGLRDELKDRISGVNVEAVVAAGARGDWSLVVPDGSIVQVVESYSKAVQQVFYLGIGISVTMFFATFGTGWVDIRKKEDVEPETDRPLQQGQQVEGEKIEAR